ncbi:GNAT family N-acetyltransferase [Sphingomonas sp. Leaf4]|uniref:GNAT family N-acetyltransferase n=1 Tax=Sphingomonas sp. Leaf4 TaxID=2876553 RepID=UPI001E3FECB9|nr:GNAT family N-acetyltransferase [Sphingomonas sp. Leaf4]
MSDTRDPVTLIVGTPAMIGAVDRVMRSAFDPRYGEAWTPAQCLGMMSLPGVWLTLACLDDDVVGFALSRAIAGDAELLLIAVLPEQRGHGIGATLLGEAVAGAARRGAVQICLEMRANNPATRLYLRAGFVKRGERRGYYAGTQGERFDAHTYVCPIAS